jgi:hypothetical protein
MVESKSSSRPMMLKPAGWDTGANGVKAVVEPSAKGEMDVTQTARWKVAQRHKRLVISRTLRDRAQRDPRRHPANTTPAAPGVNVLGR